MPDGDDDTTINYFDLFRMAVGAGVPGGDETTQEAVTDVGWSDIKGTVPEPLRKLANNPVTYIMGLVLAWVVEQVWGAVKTVIEVILGIGTYLTGLIGLTGSALVAPVTGTAGGVAGIVLSAHETAVSTALGLGFAAPAATAAVVAGEMLLFLYLADTAVRVLAEVGTGIPILGPAFGLFGAVYRAVMRALSGLRRAFL